MRSLCRCGKMSQGVVEGRRGREKRRHRRNGVNREARPGRGSGDWVPRHVQPVRSIPQSRSRCSHTCGARISTTAATCTRSCPLTGWWGWSTAAATGRARSTFRPSMRRRTCRRSETSWPLRVTRWSTCAPHIDGNWREARRSLRLDAGLDNLTNRNYALPLGGRYWIGDKTGKTQVPAMGRSVFGGLTFEF